MNRFMQSTSGRLLSFAFSLSLLGGGAAVHMSAPTSLYVMATSVFIAIVLCVAAMQLAVEEFEAHAIYGVILLPFLLFLYILGVGLSMAFYPALSYGFIALGLGSLAVGLRTLAAKPSPAVKASLIPVTAVH